MREREGGERESMGERKREREGRERKKERGGARENS